VVRGPQYDKRAVHEGLENYATRNANGTGPFILKDRQPGVRTVLVRNPNWWGLKDQPIDIDEVVFTRIENAATRVAALLSGELDMVYNVPPQDIERIRGTAGMKIWQTPSCGRSSSAWTRAATSFWNPTSRARTRSRTSGCAKRSTRRSTRTRSSVQGHARLCPSDGADGRARDQRL
jgi:ABC-type transport system substrate-binding protein